MVISTWFSCSASAQTKAFSSIWSFDGIGLGYEHFYGQDRYLDASLKADLTSLFYTGTGRTGITGSVTWNTIFAETQSSEGNDVNFYYGSGLFVGLARDFEASEGFIFGLVGRIGAECSFKRNIGIAVSIAPVIGMHVSQKNESTNMRLYRNGLIYSLLPEVQIKYTF